MFEPTTLDLLILALVARGVGTAYALKQNADISVASSLATLQRLEKAGFLAASIASRRSRHYKLTGSGRRLLRSGLGKLDQILPHDLESTLRIAYLAASRSRRAGADFLVNAAEASLREAETIKVLPAPARDAFDSGLGYRWMKMIVQKNRSAAQAKALKEIATLLRK